MISPMPGATPLTPLFELVAPVTSIETLLPVIGKLERGGTSGFIQAFVDNDPGNPERYLVFLEQGELIVDLPTAQFFAEDGGLAVPRIRQFLSKMKKD